MGKVYSSRPTSGLTCCGKRASSYMLRNRHNKPEVARISVIWAWLGSVVPSTSTQTPPPAVLTLKNADASGSESKTRTLTRTVAPICAPSSAHVQHFMTIIWVNCQQQKFLADVGPHGALFACGINIASHLDGASHLFWGPACNMLHQTRGISSIPISSMPHPIPEHWAGQ